MGFNSYETIFDNTLIVNNFILSNISLSQEKYNFYLNEEISLNR